MEIDALLRELSQAHGVSGYEDNVRDIIRREFESLSDELRADSMGNLIGLKRGEPTADTPHRSIMLAAHMDEIGLIVTKLEEGFLRFATVGGIDVRTLPGQEVTVHGRMALRGIIGSRPPHVLPPKNRKKVIPLESLFIDVGLAQADLEDNVRVGDLITLHSDFAELQGGYVSGKALDDRAGVASLVHCLRSLSSMRCAWDVFAVATVQEEIGLRGAITSAYGVDPDIAIAIDVDFGRTPGLSEAQSSETGKGPGIDLGPNVHPVVRQRLVDTAREHEIPFQTSAVPGHSGTDGWAIQVARDGVPTALLSIPLRYMHSPVETVSIRDIDRTGRLMALFAVGLDDRFAAELGLQ